VTNVPLPPHPDPWHLAHAHEAGFDTMRLADAATFADTHETTWQRDIQAQLEAGNFEPPPDNAILGPTAPRGAPNGLVLRGGRLVARWGDTRQVDMTFSVAKSYLSLLAGIAVGDGLIADLDAKVAEGPEFEGPQNNAITWRQLLTQTSEWEGTLFGKEDRIDRYRSLATEFAGSAAPKKGDPRPLQAPGSYWEYNDVRVNALSLALLRRFGRALPEVFAERIMRPIGGSQDWRWEGYSTSWITIGGRLVQSVSGGGHWGGGVFIHAEDQARIGQLMLNGGLWGDTRILPAGWVVESIKPVAIKPDYGLLWWLNPGGAYKPSATPESYFAIGAGGNVTWIDPANDLVAVLRWIDMAALDEWIGLVMAARAT
jgi:CubicO group peptidase (beta-lactamase class C family)